MRRVSGSVVVQAQGQLPSISRRLCSAAGSNGMNVNRVFNMSANRGCTLIVIGRQGGERRPKYRSAL
jgi:hypothetical protein